MRSYLRLPLDIATALLFSLSIGIATGVVAISFTHRLGDGLLFGIPGLVLAAAGFGYSIWNTYRPRSKVLRPPKVVAPQQAASMGAPS